MASISYARHQFPPAVIQHAVWLYLRFTLSYRDVEDLLAERGLDISYETVRRWVRKRCLDATFRSGGLRVIVGADGGFDTCRFQSISICRSRPGASKCSPVQAGDEAGRCRRKPRSLARAT